MFRPVTPSGRVRNRNTKRDYFAIRSKREFLTDWQRFLLVKQVNADLDADSDADSDATCETRLLRVGRPERPCGLAAD